MAKDTYPKPEHGWTCFFCGETFTTFGSARDHFGADPLADAACRIKDGEERGLVMALRKTEEKLARYRAEDSDMDREFHAMRADHAQALRREEEKGYARGLADGQVEAQAKLEAQAREIERLRHANRTRPDYDLHCQECGRAHILDTSLPSEIWSRIADPNELLCTTCIDDRLAKHGLTAEAELYYSGTALKSRLYDRDLQKRAEAAEAERDALKATLTGAMHALRSYQYGNAATDLAKSQADACEAAIASPREAESHG